MAFEPGRPYQSHLALKLRQKRQANRCRQDRPGRTFDLCVCPFSPPGFYIYIREVLLLEHEPRRRSVPRCAHPSPNAIASRSISSSSDLGSSHPSSTRSPL
eukprot:492585-Prymnesium_polylepis.1